MDAVGRIKVVGDVLCIELCWDDLNEEMKGILTQIYGDSQNWDVMPMTLIELGLEGDEITRANQIVTGTTVQ